MSEKCVTCGLPVASPEEFMDGRARYADTPGGHADRHTLVIEAAEDITHPRHPAHTVTEEEQA